MSQSGTFDSGTALADIETLTGNAGGAVGPDGAGNVDVLGDGTVVIVTGTPASNLLTITLGGTLATSYVTDSGTAVPAANILNVLGSHGINTTGAGSTVTALIDNTITLGDLAVVTTGNDALTLTSGDITFSGTGVNAAGNINMPDTGGTTAGDIGVVNWGGSRFIHNFGTQNVFVGSGAGNFTMSGSENTALGDAALDAITTTSFTTAIGSRALSGKTSGGFSVAIGSRALEVATTGGNQTVVGHAACMDMTTGGENCVMGTNAMTESLTASRNLALGTGSDQGGASEKGPLFQLASGTDNVAIGCATSAFLTGPGFNYTTSESSNIVIGGATTGTVGESNVMRLGTTGSGEGQVDTCYIAGVDGVNVGSVVDVLTMSSDQVGTAALTAGTGIAVTAGANTLTVGLTAAAEETAIHGWNGYILETPDVSVTSDGVTITAAVEQTGGGDLTVVFSDGFHNWDTTPADTIALTAGSDVSPQINFIYFLQSTKALTVSTSNWPATEHAPLATVLCQSAASVQTDGVYKLHAWTDHVVSTTQQGHISDLSFWIRAQAATWQSGVAQTLTITPNGGAPDNVIFTSASGVVLQLHDHTFPAFSGTPDIYTVNDSATPFNIVTDLNALLTDSTGASMTGKYFSLVIWGVVSEDTATNSKLMVNLPGGSYNTQSNLISDPLQFANFSIPTDFRGTGFLIAELQLRHQNAASGTWTEIDLVDLRGQFPQSTAGGATVGQTEFVDNTFRILDEGDSTKEIAFQASGITTATTRTLTVQDADGTIALSGVANFGTGVTSMTDHGVLLGSGTSPITITAVGADGQLLIGATGADPVFASVISTDGSISITEGTNSLDLEVVSGGLAWNEETGTSATMAVDNGYVANNAGLVTFTLPDTAAFGSVIRVTGIGAGGWLIAQNASESIVWDETSSTTVGVGGSLASSDDNDAVEILCTVADTTWLVLSSKGNITIV